MKLARFIFFMLILNLAHAAEKITLNDNGFEARLLKYGAPGSASVIIIPPTGGANFLDRSYANLLQEAGINAYILTGHTDDDELNYDLGIHQRFYSRVLHALEMTVNHIPVDHKIGLLGTSVGGIHTAVAVTRIPRVESAFVITAGAHIPSIIAYSNQAAMELAWKKRKEMYHFKTRAEYVKALEEAIELKIMPVETKKKLGMIIGRYDKTVPLSNQELLKEYWKPQVEIRLPYGHMTSILMSWFLKRGEIVRFFSDLKE